MKQFFIFFFLLFSLHTSGQNLKKLLLAADYDSVQANRTVYKTIDRNNSKPFDGFEGTIGIIKLGSKLHYFFIGEAKKFSNNGDLITIMNSDSLGYLQSYHETDPKNGVIFDCTYEYKKINGKLLRLEKQNLYYGPEQPWEEGQRFLEMTNEGIGNRYASSNKNYGKWTYFTRSGEIEKTQDFGEIK